MTKFTNFKTWKTDKSNEAAGEATPVEPAEHSLPANADLLTLIEELSDKRNLASRNNDGLGRQIYDIDIRVAKLEMQKNELVAKKKDLESARSISEKKKRLPRNNHD